MKTVKKIPHQQYNMEKMIIKINVGIDVAKADFVATVARMTIDLDITYSRTKKFKSTEEGFEEMFVWVQKMEGDKNIDISFTMESTGVYYESLAYFLFFKNQIVHVVLPNKAKKYFETLDYCSKTDKLDSRALGRLGAERKLREWRVFSPIFRNLKKLTREREALQNDITRLKNQLHAEEYSAYKFANTIKRYKQRIKLLGKDLKIIEKEIDKLIDSDELVSKKIKHITSIPGIGTTTAAVIVSETNGFAEITGIKQLTSYAGYDVVIRESGNWRGNSRISKRGNSHIRRALHMPSLSSKKHSKTYKKFYERLNQRKQNGLITAVAVQRKLLGLMYTLWKNNEDYIENHVEYLKEMELLSA